MRVSTFTRRNPTLTSFRWCRRFSTATNHTDFVPLTWWVWIFIYYQPQFNHKKQNKQTNKKPLVQVDETVQQVTLFATQVWQPEMGPHTHTQGRNLPKVVFRPPQECCGTLGPSFMHIHHTHTNKINFNEIKMLKTGPYQLGFTLLACLQIVKAILEIRIVWEAITTKKNVKR